MQADNIIKKIHTIRLVYTDEPKHYDHMPNITCFYLRHGKLNSILRRCPGVPSTKKLAVDPFGSRSKDQFEC